MHVAGWPWPSRFFVARYKACVRFEDVQKLCLSWPGTTLTVQWGDMVVFKVVGKMFAVANLEPDQRALAFKCSDEHFAELTELEGVIPAPYLARAQWVSLEHFDTLSRAELSELLRDSYALVVAKLTRKQQAGLSLPAPSKRKSKP